MTATSTPFQTGRTEEIRLDVRDSAGDPVTGATGVLIRIQRASDSQFFDFDDSTFKAVGWTEKDTALVEVDSSELPGIYELAGGFDSAAITNISTDDTYLVYPIKNSNPDTVSAVLPSPAEFKIGWFADGVGIVAIVSATIGSAVPDTLELAGWLVRNADVVTAGLVSAVIEVQDANGTVVVASGTMSGPNAAGVFTRSVSGVILASSTNYISILEITDSSGPHKSITALPTTG